MAKKPKKEIYDIAAGHKVELTDDKRSEMAAALLTGTGLAVEGNEELINSIEQAPLTADDIIAAEYGKVMREPCQIELLKAILRELVMIRIGGNK